MAEEMITFDEILADPMYKSEFDRRVTKALATVQQKLNTEVDKNKEYEKQLNEANTAIEGFKALDVDGIQKAADEWKAKAEQARKDAEAQVAAVKFDALLEGAITKAGGRSAKAVKAMLDLDALKGSKNQEADLQAALAELSKSDGYLFETGETPPPYAGGTGAAPVPGKDPASMTYTELCAYMAQNPDAKI